MTIMSPTLKFGFRPPAALVTAKGGGRGEREREYMLGAMVENGKRYQVKLLTNE